MRRGTHLVVWINVVQEPAYARYAEGSRRQAQHFVASVYAAERKNGDDTSAANALQNLRAVRRRVGMGTRREYGTEKHVIVTRSLRRLNFVQSVARATVDYLGLRRRRRRGFPVHCNDPSRRRRRAVVQQRQTVTRQRLHDGFGVRRAANHERVRAVSRRRPRPRLPVSYFGRTDGYPSKPRFSHSRFFVSQSRLEYPMSFRSIRNKNVVNQSIKDIFSAWAA